jgi:DHA3 family macrolide efflux protein-like MFS transporter
MMLVAPAMAYVFYTFMGMKAVFWVDVVTATVGITMLLLIKTVKVAPKTIENHAFREMADGISYIWKTKWLRQIMSFYFIFALMFGPLAFLTPLMVVRSFGNEEWRLLAHEIVFAVGMIAGGLLLGILADKFRNRTYMIIFACVAIGIATFIMGFSPSFMFYLICMIPLGFTMPFVNSGTMTTLQTQTEPLFLGRVLGFLSIIASSTAPLSMIVFGPLADHVRIETMLIITGALMTGIALYMMRFKEMIAAGEVSAEEGRIA